MQGAPIVDTVAEDIINKAESANTDSVGDVPGSGEEKSENASEDVEEEDVGAFTPDNMRRVPFIPITMFNTKDVATGGRGPKKEIPMVWGYLAKYDDDRREFGFKRVKKQMREDGTRAVKEWNRNSAYVRRLTKPLGELRSS